MTVQVFGFGLLILSAISLSVSLIRRANQRLSELEELCRLISHIRNNIEAFMMPLSDIFRSFEPHQDAVKEFLSMAEHNGFQYAADHAQLSVGGEGKRILGEFAEKIGAGYREDELRLCTYTLNMMNELLNAEKDEHSKRLKLYKTLPVMSALSVALLLL